MAVIAMEPVSKAAAHVGSTKMAAYAGTAEAATHMHSCRQSSLWHSEFA
jgi:hypothetical protein